jgi:hypothetical protein
MDVLMGINANRYHANLHVFGWGRQASLEITPSSSY